MWWFLISCKAPVPSGPSDTPPPRVPEVRIEPAGAISGLQPLTCVTDASAFRWEVDGRAWATGGSIAAEDTRAGRSWSCIAGTLPAEQEVTATVELEPLGSNLLVFLVDDIGIDKVGVYGALDDAPPQTPVIDGLAAEGVRYHRAWATPVCSPTRATLLTGRFGRRTGLGRIIDEDRPNQILSYDETFVPEMLAWAPSTYSTAMVGKWHLAWLRPQYLDHPSAGAGFEYHAGSMDNLARSVVPAVGRGFYFWEENLNGTLSFREIYATRRSVQQATDLTHAMPEPWFLYVPLNGAHVPYHRPPDDLVYTPAADDSSPELFRSMVESIDIAIGQVLDGMDPLVRERTTIFVIGDNGTAQNSTLPRVDGEDAKGSVLEGGVRVPFIVAGKGVTARGVSHQLVHTVDLFDTIAAITGADLDAMDATEATLPRDSVSFLPTFADLEAPTRAFNYDEAFRPNGPGPYTQSDRAVTDGRFKLVTREGDVNAEFFFDLDSPDGEEVDLFAAPLSDEAAAAEALLRQELQRLVADLVYDSPE